MQYVLLTIMEHAEELINLKKIKNLSHVYSVEILLMMDSGPVRNIQNTLSNKCEKQRISLACVIGIYHDARSSECQVNFYNLLNIFFGLHLLIFGLSVCYQSRSTCASLFRAVRLYLTSHKQGDDTEFNFCNLHLTLFFWKTRGSMKFNTNLMWF